MKRTIKIFIFVVTVALGFTTYAQSVDDAILFSTNNYLGSARTMAMGNAFTALGGDVGALVLNPAASGVMRSSQISLTLGATTAKNDISGVRDHFSILNVPSFGFVGTYDTGRSRGIFSFNVGLAINSRSNFNSLISVGTNTGEASYLGSLASGLAGVNYKILEYDEEISYSPFNNSKITWPEALAWNTYVLATTPDSETDYLASTENTFGTDIVLGGELAQDYYRKRDGGISDITINLGSNINDELFLGVNLNISSVDMNLTESYAEEAYNPNDFQDGFVRYAQQYALTTSGAGLGLQLGVIYAPTALPGLRLGASYTTRTLYDLHDSWRYYAQSEFNNGNQYYLNSPLGEYNYEMHSPSKFSLGAAYVFGNRGLLSVDYESTDYRTIYYTENGGQDFSYKDLNSKISNQCCIANSIRIGAEVWVYDNLSVRAGEMFFSEPATWAQTRKVHSLGAGWRFNDYISFDVAYQRSRIDSDFQMYNDYAGANVPKFTSTNVLSNLMFSMTCKF